MKTAKNKSKHDDSTLQRIGGYLHRLIPISNEAGDIISYALKPIMLEFKGRDIMQVVIGASMLAIPVSFTEEIWNLGTELPAVNTVILALISLLFISVFVYFNFYSVTFKKYEFEFFKRVIGTYFISLLVVAVILTLIQKCPWFTDFPTAIRRVILVAFPASMSGTLTDTLK
ncbi:DUF2391 family protein [Flavobacteriaceae bacterium]|nr:DUF2391 family protein [Flavobacteriaceae bacterium]